MSKFVMDRNVIHSGTEIKRGQLCPESLIAEMSKKGFAHPLPEPAAPAPAPVVHTAAAPLKPGNAK